MHLYDLLENLEIDPDNEFRNIMYMLMEDDIRDLGYKSTLVQYINTFFRNLNVRRSLLNFEELIKTLKLDAPKNQYKKKFAIDEFILLSEVVLTTFLQANEKVVLRNSRGSYKRINEIKNSINYVIDKINHTMYEKNKYIYIFPKTPEIEEAIEYIENKVTALELIHYNHSSLNGNLSEKKNVLTQLGAYIEPILNSKKLSSNGYSRLESDIGFYLNNFNIRHNNLDGAKRQQICVDAHSDGSLENWYDKTYNTILMCIIANKQIEYRDELKALKTSYGM